MQSLSETADLSGNVGLAIFEASELTAHESQSEIQNKWMKRLTHITPRTLSPIKTATALDILDKLKMVSLTGSQTTR